MLLFWAFASIAVPHYALPNSMRTEDVLYGKLPVLWWSVAAASVIAAIVASRRPRFGRAVVVGTAAGVAYVGMSFVLYRWGIPWRRVHGGELLFGLPAAFVGALAGGAFAGRRVVRPPRVWAGVVVAVVGALVLPGVLERGAALSMKIEAIPYASPAALPPGRYAVWAVGGEPLDGCRVPAPLRLTPVPVRPEAPGVDATPSYRWVAYLDVPGPGSHPVPCGPDAAYVIGSPPEIGGAIGWVALRPVPLFLIFLAGALPGLMMIFGVARKRFAGDRGGSYRLVSPRERHTKGDRDEMA